MSNSTNYCHRFSAKIISFCLWLYNSFWVGYQDVEKILLYRGIEVTYQTLRKWSLKFSRHFQNHHNKGQSN